MQKFTQSSSTGALKGGGAGHPKIDGGIFSNDFLPPVFTPTPTIYERVREASEHCPNDLAFNERE